MNTEFPYEEYELPRIVSLKDNLFGASFYLMKLLPASYILKKAEEKNLIRKGSKIVETTSGTFGLALAMISAVKGYKLTLISDPAIDKHLYNRLVDLGANVEIMHLENPNEQGGYQQIRLSRLHQFLKENPEAYWPEQYTNYSNPLSYAKLAEHLLDKVGQIDILVGPVGSGGSMVGTSSFLNKIFPELMVVGVDTNYSILFGQPDGKRLLRGLGNSIMPKNLDHTKFSKVSWVPAPVAFEATRVLHRKFGLYMGGTSGASYLVADWLSKQYPDKKIVVFFPDDGHRYADTIYEDEWLYSVEGYTNVLPEYPILVDNPNTNLSDWTIMDWNHRKLQDANISIEESKTMGRYI